MSTIKIFITFQVLLLSDIHSMKIRVTSKPWFVTTERMPGHGIGVPKSGESRAHWNELVTLMMGLK